MSKNELEKIWDLPSELPYREKVEEIQKMFVDGNHDNNDEYKGHHDGRVGSYYKTSHRNKTK